MKDSKLIFALSQLSIYEKNAFLKYVHSPYFNQHDVLISLAEIYIQNLKEELERWPEKEDLWKAVNPNEPYDDARFRKYNSELLRLYEGFIALQVYENHPFQQDVYKMDAIVNRELSKLHNSASKSSFRSFERNINKSAEYFHGLYQLKELDYKYKLATERDRSRFRDVLKIDEASSHLDVYYLGEKLRLFAVLLTWKRLYNVDKSMDYIAYILRLAKNEKYHNTAPIQMYLSIIDMIQHPDDEEKFNRYKVNLGRFIQHFTQEEITAIYEAGFNFCVARVNVGDSRFEQEAFLLYKEALKDNAIIKNGEVSSASFNNVIIFALRVGEYDWAEGFVKDYANYLNDSIRESTVAFSLARIEFYKKNYEKVIQHLINVEYNSVVIALSSKVILLFSYFELNEYDALESLINSFKTYISREKSISPKRKKSYSNLLSFTKKIANVNPRDQKKINSIEKQLSETDNVASRPWLLQKLEALKK